MFWSDPDIVRLYVGRSEEEYKEANESDRWNRVFLASDFPSVYNGVDWRSGPGFNWLQRLSCLGFCPHIVYITLNLCVDSLHFIAGVVIPGCRVEFRYWEIKIDDGEGVSDRDFVFLCDLLRFSRSLEQKLPGWSCQ